jgi:hypothetical protein
VAVGDDLIGSVAGGSVLSRVSRRFGEGVVNGALTARVGVAAMEVCRPLPFGAETPAEPSPGWCAARSPGCFPRASAAGPSRHPMTPDPFRHHPGLRGKIKPAAESFFRDFTTDVIREMAEARGGHDTFPFHPDTVREAIRAEALKGHAGDLLVFAYGSLIWDPALDFCEVRRAHAPQHARRFILVDTYGGRGTAEKPGLMAALDDGEGCDGLVFRIASEKVETETEILFRVKRLGQATFPASSPWRWPTPTDMP